MAVYPLRWSWCRREFANRERLVVPRRRISLWILSDTRVRTIGFLEQVVLLRDQSEKTGNVVGCLTVES